MYNHPLRQYSTVSCHTGQVAVKVAVAGLIGGIGGSAVAGNDDVFFLLFRHPWGAKHPGFYGGEFAVSQKFHRVREKK